MNRYAEIIVETKQYLVFKQFSQQREKSICPLCQNKIEMLTVNEAALLIGCSSSAIFGWIELGWLHFKETSEELLVCRNSLGEIITIKN